MQEAFLHFIWQHQYFDKTGLVTHDGMAVNIIHPGTYNTNAGPDFNEAKVQMGNMEWRGHVELHVKSSDWIQHRHHEDDAYNNVILHVVWHHDHEIRRKDNTILPTVELQGLIPDDLILSYRKLVNSPFRVPCEQQLKTTRDIIWISTLDKMVMERLMIKSDGVRELLKKNVQDWEETAYQLLAKNFGFKINSEPFLILAQNLPYRMLKRHSDHLHQIEALLFGQAGFLHEQPEDEYQDSLKKEYKFLKHKYNLQDRLFLHQWKLLRLRPANFPTVRLAQFASVIRQLESICMDFLQLDNIKQLKSLLKVKQSEYWIKHYQFGKPVTHKIPCLGDASIENIAINTVVPLMVAYSQYVDDIQYTEKAVSLLQSIKPEINRISSYWRSLDVEVATAFDSQALIQLYNEYCSKRKCLSCNVGVSLIRS